jgi:hypothetical protein
MTVPFMLRRTILRAFARFVKFCLTMVSQVSRVFIAKAQFLRPSGRHIAIFRENGRLGQRSYA